MLAALTCPADELFEMIPDCPIDLVPSMLKNPALVGGHLIQLLKRRDLPEELVKVICKLPVSAADHSVQVALSRHPNIPGAQLLSILPNLYLFELLNLCILPEMTPDHKLAAERIIIQRLPQIPLGNKLTLARRATSAILEALVKEGDTRTLDACLSNPRLKEGAVYQFLRSGKADAESISMIARSQRWQHRPNIREAILTNPKTPLVWFVLWLPAMKAGDLKRIASSSRLTAAQRKAVEERLNGRSHRHTSV